jgi:hypothetical protein
MPVSLAINTVSTGSTLRNEKILRFGRGDIFPRWLANLFTLFQQPTYLQNAMEAADTLIIAVWIR